MPSGTKGYNRPVAMSWADSPDGPWTPLNKVIIPNGDEGTALTLLAVGLYVPDACTDTKDGRGITWGLAHIYNVVSDWSKDQSMLVRFDYDLSRDVHDAGMKGHFEWQEPDIYFRRGLSNRQHE